MEGDVLMALGKQHCTLHASMSAIMVARVIFKRMEFVLQDTIVIIMKWS